MEIRPLTRPNAAGLVYKRLPGVEEQIEEALALAPTALLVRARIANFQVPGYLQEECLVYLIREFHRRCQEVLVSELSAILLRRSAKFVNRRLQALTPDQVDEAYREVVTELFAKILAVDDDRGDFLQVRYWKALERLTTTAFTNQTTEHERAQQTTTFSPSDDEGMEAVDDEGAVFSALGETVINISSPERLALIHEGLGVLPEPQRTAFILHHYYKWPIESKDAAVPTISKYFGKSPRTIHNWFTQAEQALRPWREGGEERGHGQA